MAIAVSDILDEDQLAEQAAALDNRAEQLSDAARELRQQAIELRLQIERQNREPLPFVHRKGVAPERDARFLARIGDLLGQIGPCPSSALADHLNAPRQRVYQALLALEKSGAAKRSGIRRGTVWALAEDEDLSGHAPIASAYTLVLAAAQKLDTFDVDMIDGELSMLTRRAIQIALRQLVGEGRLTEEKDGRRKIYAFEKPEAATVNRPKAPPPEAKVVELARKTPLRSRGSIVEGTGKGKRPSGNSLVKELLRELADWPIVEITRHTHTLRFKVDGELIARCSLTPGASSLSETRRHLRQAGIDVRA